MRRLLNDTTCRNAKPNPNGKPKKYTDGGGMYLLVGKTGKYWRYNYKFAGKFKTYAIGLYPDISLKEARILHEEARDLLAKDIDPMAYKKLQRLSMSRYSGGETFETVAREWFLVWSKEHTERHASKVFARLENDVFPWLGNRAVKDIEPPEILIVLNRIVSRGAVETAHRVKQSIGQAFRYAVATGKAERDKTQDLKGALPSYRKKHFPAITDPKQLGHLLRVIDDYHGSLVVRCAFRLAPLVMLRPSELTGAEWSEIDFERALWSIPAKRMKASKAVKDENAYFHEIPLSRQAIKILQEIQPLTGRFQHVFTGTRDRRKPMNASTINIALRRLGYQDIMTAHSFRATASSLLNEMGFNPDAIERQLAHTDKNKVRSAYNRAQYLEERRDMLQQWADYLDTLKNGGGDDQTENKTSGKVVSFNQFKKSR